MKKNRYIIGLVLILILIVSLIVFNRTEYFSKETSNNFGKENLNKEDSIENNSIAESTIQRLDWSDLKIIPRETIEGTHYTFTAFDIINDSVIVIAESYNKNIIRFFNLNNQVFIDSIELELVPFEILYHKNILHILCENNTILMIKNKQVINQYYIENKNTYLFDKFLVLNDNVSLLMSDGSSLIFENGGLENKESLVFMDTEIWILKNSNFSFVINDKNNTVVYSYSNKEELGSITIAGGMEDIYCCIDKMYPGNPLQLGRIISSSKTNFQEELIKLPRKNFSFIKNDFRIHGDILYLLEIKPDGLTIKRKHLK
jgi:hypothetical protein